MGTRAGLELWQAETQKEGTQPASPVLGWGNAQGEPGLGSSRQGERNP